MLENQTHLFFEWIFIFGWRDTDQSGERKKCIQSHMCNLKVTHLKMVMRLFFWFICAKQTKQVTNVTHAVIFTNANIFLQTNSNLWKLKFTRVHFYKVTIGITQLRSLIYKYEKELIVKIIILSDLENDFF